MPVSGESAAADERQPRHPSARSAPSRDRAALRAFGAWLDGRPAIAAPSIADESRMLEALFGIARRVGLDLHDPADIDEIVEVLFESEDPDTPEALENALDTLHDYVLFRIDTSRDLEAWDEALEVVEDAIDDTILGSDAIAAAIEAAAQIDADERRTALVQSRIVAAVTQPE